MAVTDFLRFFVNTDTPFMLLFVSLFFYFVKANNDREARLNHIIEDELKKMNSEMQVLMQVWKILIEKELEAKK
jgi:hypothetical protein